LPELISKRGIRLAASETPHELGVRHPPRPARNWAKHGHRSATDCNHDVLTGLNAPQQSTRVIAQLA